jgi:hypothetical protein
MSSAEVTFDAAHVPHEDFFNFAIEFLQYCESNKKWEKNDGKDFSATCGYTGPGIGLVIKLFMTNNIYSKDTLYEFLGNLYNSDMEQFINIINETIGNFVDIIDVCPVTGVNNGIYGLLKEQKEKQYEGSIAIDEPIKVYKVAEDGSNLVEGVNVISFTSRQFECDTFHHATLYMIPESDICYIIDSWSTSEGVQFECRPLTFRQFTVGEVIYALNRLNSDDILPEEITYIFQYYFIAHYTFIEKIPDVVLFSVHTVSPDYIEEVYTICEQRIKSREQTKSDFGGKPRKKNRKLRKKTRKLRKRSKRYSKAVRKYKK